MKKHPPSAFSLIEVVVALGLFSFCIVGILALLAVAMGSARSVGDESNAVHIASSIAGIWEVAPLGQTTALAYTNTNNVVEVDMGTFTVGENPDNNQTLYYDGDGNRTTNSVGASLKLDYAVTNEGNDTYKLAMTFSWPANAPEGSAALNQRTYHYVFTK